MQIHRDRSGLVIARGWGERRKKGDSLTCVRFLVGLMRIFWNWMVMFVQHHECAKCHWVVHFKMVKVVNVTYILPELKKSQLLKILSYFYTLESPLLTVLSLWGVSEILFFLQVFLLSSNTARLCSSWTLNSFFPGQGLCFGIWARRCSIDLNVNECPLVVKRQKSARAEVRRKWECKSVFPGFCFLHLLVL